MKNLKKFENFNMSQSKYEELNGNPSCYYCCDECDNIWIENNEVDCCKFCESDEIEELHEEEWKELSKNQER